MAAEDYIANQNTEFVDSAGSAKQQGNGLKDLSLQILCQNLYFLLSALQWQLR